MASEEDNLADAIALSMTSNTAHHPNDPLESMNGGADYSDIDYVISPDNQSSVDHSVHREKYYTRYRNGILKTTLVFTPYKG